MTQAAKATLPRRPITPPTQDGRVGAIDGRPKQTPIPVADVSAYTPPPTPTPATVEPGQRPETAYAAARMTFAVTLPSKGRFYGGKLPGGEVEVYLLTAAEDKILAELTPDNIPEIFDAILARCVKSPISPEDLLETDRYYLLLMLRAYSLGDEFTFPFECPQNTDRGVPCKQSFVHTAHIPGEFEMIDGKATKEPFNVTLPGGDVVELRLLRGRDTKDINRYRKQNADPERGDPGYYYQHAKCVMSVNGKPPIDISSAIDWFKALPLKDVRAVRKALDEAYPGVLNAVRVSCPRCKNETVVRVPVNSLNFFD